MSRGRNKTEWVGEAWRCDRTGYADGPKQMSLRDAPLEVGREACFDFSSAPPSEGSSIPICPLSKEVGSREVLDRLGDSLVPLLPSVCPAVVSQSSDMGKIQHQQ